MPLAYDVEIEGGNRATIYVVPEDPGPTRDHATLLVYAREIRRQCQYGLRAIAMVNESAPAQFNAIAERRFEDATVAADDVWFYAQSLLGALAVLSRIFTGDDIRGTAAEKQFALDRAARLQQTLDVDENNPIIDRKVRNSFEHIDQRLDRRTSPDAAELYQDSNIIPSDGVRYRVYADEARTTVVHPMRELDMGAEMLAFSTSGVPLDAVGLELTRLIEVCDALDAQPVPPGSKRVGFFLQVLPSGGRDDWEQITQLEN